VGKLLYDNIIYCLRAMRQR